MMRRHPFVRLALAAALVAVAGAAFTSCFSGGLVVPVAVFAAVVATVLSAFMTGVRRLSVWAVLVASIVVSLVVVAVAIRSPWPAEVGRALVHGPRRLLTSGVPADTDRSLLAVPALLTFLVGVFTAECTQRLRNGVAGLCGPLVLLLVGFAFGTAEDPDHVAVAVAFAALALLATVADPVAATSAVGGGAATRARRRNVVSAVPLVLVLTLAATAVAPNLPGADARERFTLRRIIEPEVRAQALDNPLDLLAPYLSNPKASEVLTVRVAGWAAPPELRLATLEDYDGETFSSSATFVPAGRRLPRVKATPGTEAVMVTQDVTVESLESAFLPALDRPVEVEAPSGSLLVDRATGALLSTAGRLPTHYTVRSSVAERSPLITDEAGRDAAARAALQLPDELAEEFEDLAKRILPDGTAPSVAANDLATVLRDKYKVTAAGQPVTTGLTLQHLRCFLIDPKCRMQGTREQFAAAYVLLARLRDLPARLVVGFRPRRVAAANTWVVDTHDITAWAEVRFAGAGWVSYDPVPADASAAPVPEVTEGKEKKPVQPPPPGGGDGDGKDPDSRRSVSETGSDTGASARLVGWLVLPLVAVLALVAPAGLRALRRRRRRESPSPRRRVAGAWAEAVDRLGEVGYRSYRAAALSDVLSAARATAGGERVAPLASLADRAGRAGFARRDPPESEAEEAWRELGAFEKGLRTSLSRRDRLRRYFVVRSAAVAR